MEKVMYYSEKYNNQNDPYNNQNDPYNNQSDPYINQNGPYRDLNTWVGPYRSEWEMPKGRGKGQGAKGDSMLKTDTAGEIYKKSTRSIKTSERSVVGVRRCYRDLIGLQTGDLTQKR